MNENKFINNIRNPYYIHQNNESKKGVQVQEYTYANKEYLNKLIEQYKKATGTYNIDLDSPTFIMDFNNWMAINNGIGSITYMHLLEDLGLYINQKSCAEIGKGYRDSLVSETERTIITPYPENLQNRFTGQTINSNFNIQYGVPMIYQQDELNIPKIIKPTEVDTFMTFNPYLGIDNSWAQIHYNPKYKGIILGVFGKKEDKDKDTKIKELIMLRSLLEDDYIYEDCSLGDSYCHILATDTYKRKIRK